MKNSMKTIDVGKLSMSTARRISSVIGEKLKDTGNKVGDKINLGKLAEKLAERKEKALTENKKEEKE